jgi:hypothetical protein
LVGSLGAARALAATAAARDARDEM